MGGHMTYGKAGSAMTPVSDLHSGEFIQLYYEHSPKSLWHIWVRVYSWLRPSWWREARKVTEKKHQQQNVGTC
jgi:hypothetical protein